MMPNVTRGDRFGGLLTYLVGEGRFNEHTEPHLVNADSATFTMYGDGELDRATALAIAADLDAPRTAFEVEVNGGHVWHCSLAIKAEDGQLSDEQWAEIAQDFVDEMGFVATSGKADCRWVAVRHGLSKAGNDHIHIAVNLVREDGTKASIHHDYSRSQRVAGVLERKYGLSVLESRGAGISERGEKPAERAIAERMGAGEVVSVRLERGVRAAAGASLDEGEFVRRVHQGGFIMRPRFAAGRDDVVTGYSVAVRPEPGVPIRWFGGGRLARDLTLARLREGWSDNVTSSQQAIDEWRATWRNPMRYRPVHPGREMHAAAFEVWHEQTQQIITLTDQLRSIPITDRSTWARVAKETSAAFAAWSERVEATPGPLADAARALARSAQIRAYQVRPRPAGLATAAGAAMLLTMAAKGGQGTVAEAILFRQLMRTARAIHDMHMAVADAREAARIRDAFGAKLDAVRERLPALQGAPATTSVDPRAAVAARIAQAGQTPLRQPGSPLPTPLKPERPSTTGTPRERGEHGR